MRTADFARRHWQRGLLLLVAVAAIGASHAHMDVSTSLARGELPVPRPDAAQLASLGFDAVLADYYWMLAVQIVGGRTTDIRAEAPRLGQLIDVVTTLDPWVGHPYRFAALWLNDSLESVEKANRLLERGIAYHPRDWRNRHLLGFNLFFYQGEDERAAEVLESALSLPGVPTYLGALAARLRAGSGSLRVAEALLRQLAQDARDGFARAEYEKALDEVETERRARYLDAARVEYWRRRGHDIADVSDLLAGPDPVLRRLPRAHPVFPGFRWLLDPETGQIVSSFYRSRYRLHEHPLDVERNKRMRAESAESGEGRRDS